MGVDEPAADFAGNHGDGEEERARHQEMKGALFQGGGPGGQVGQGEYRGQVKKDNGEMHGKGVGVAHQAGVFLQEASQRRRQPGQGQGTAAPAGDSGRGF